MSEMKWQPIETAPKDGTPILGFWRGSLGVHSNPTGNNYGITAYSAYVGSWYDASENDNEEDTWCSPDRWMPLPPPPEDV